MVLEEDWPACRLRRHVISHLLQMHLMNVSNNTGSQYQSYAHDNAIRRTAPFDTAERAYYKTGRSPAPSVNHDWQLSRLIVERDWLNKPPMDYRTFERFCNGTRGQVYRSRQELILELFPQVEFFYPPPGIRTLSQFERRVLARRANLVGTAAMGLYLIALDQKVYQGLAELWLARLTSQPPSLPKAVTFVKVIAKSPMAPGMMTGLPQFNNNETAAISAALQDMERSGKIRFAGFLYRNSTIR